MDTYEKKYKEVLLKARVAKQNTESAVTIGILEEIFPELKESEDEKTRREIIAVLKGEISYTSEEDTQKYIAWLEKQGEQKPAWSEEDETALGDALWCCKQAASIAKDENDMGNAWYAENWLKSLKGRVQPKQEWSEEDKNFMYDTLSNLTELKDRYGEGYGNVGKCIDWLKSLKQRIKL